MHFPFQVQQQLSDQEAYIRGKTWLLHQAEQNEQHDQSIQGVYRPIL